MRCLPRKSIKRADGGLTPAALWGRKVSDLAFHAFTQKLKYLFESNGKAFGKRDRFLPTSKTHFECGWINEGLTLSDRTWTCQCGAQVERDLNAALMIKHGRAMSWSREVCKPEQSAASPKIGRAHV